MVALASKIYVCSKRKERGKRWKEEMVKENAKECKYVKGERKRQVMKERGKGRNKIANNERKRYRMKKW